MNHQNDAAKDVKNSDVLAKNEPKRAICLYENLLNKGPFSKPKSTKIFSML